MNFIFQQLVIEFCLDIVTIFEFSQWMIPYAIEILHQILTTIHNEDIYLYSILYQLTFHASSYDV